MGFFEKPLSLTLLLLLLSVAAAQATTYYGKNGSAPNQLSSWGTTSGGGGTAPSSFTTAGHVFIIEDGTTMTATGTWTIGAGGTTASTLQINSGGTLNMSTFLLTLASCNFTNSGTTSGSGGVTISGTLVTNSIAGFINSGTVSVIKSSGTATFAGDVSGGALSKSGNGTLNLGSGYTHSFSGQISRTAGTLNLGSSTLNVSYIGTVFSGTVTIGTGSTVNYSGTGNQTIYDIAYYNLGTSGSGTKTWALGSARSLAGGISVGSGTTLTTSGNSSRTLTVAGTVTVAGTWSLGGSAAKTFNGDVIIDEGGVWNETTSATFTFGGSLTNNGDTFTAGSSAHTFSGTNKTIDGSTTTTISSVTITGTYTANGPLTVSSLNSASGSLTNNSTLNLGGGCAITTLTNAGTLNVTGSGTISTSLANFTNTGTLNLDGSGAITGGITNSTGGIVNLNTSGTIDEFTNATSTSTLNISTTPTVPTITTLTVSASGNTVNYNGDGSQTVKTVAYSNLILSGSGAKTFAVTTVNGDFTLSGTATVAPSAATAFGGSVTLESGTTFNAGSRTYNVAGDWINNGTTFTNTGSTINFNGSSAQTIGGTASTTFNNLTVNNSSGVLLGVSTTVEGTLTLTSGKVTTSVYSLEVTNTATGAVTGYSSSSYIVGPLQRSMATGNSYFFPVGDASDYRPFEMNSVTCSSAVVRVTMSGSGASTVDASLLSVAARNWYADLISGSFSSATVRLTESGLASDNVVASSLAQSGNYTNRGGNSIGSTVTSDAGIVYTTSAYFAVGVDAPDPVISLSDNGTQIAAANLPVGTNNVVLHKSALAVTTANATLTGMTCTTAGSYASAGVTNLKVWYQTTSTFTGTGTLLSTYTTPGTAGSKTFPSFTSQAINATTTGYVFITADVAAGATLGQTINVNALTTSDFTFVSGSKSGSTTAGGTQTFVAGAATQYLVTSSSYGPIAGSSVTITAQLADVSGNPVSTSGNIVTWSKSASDGSFATPTSTTNASGIATVVFTSSPIIGTTTTVTGTDGSSLTGTTPTITTTGSANTRVASQSGNWHNTATWGGAAIPTTADDVVINGGYTVTIAADAATCASLTIGGASAGTLMISGPYTTTIVGNILVNSNGSFINTNVEVDNTSTLNIAGNLTVDGTFEMNSTVDDVTVVNFNGTQPQTINGSGSTCAFNNLTISNTSGVTLTRNISLDDPLTGHEATLTVSGIFDLSSYTCNRSVSGGSLTVTGTLKIGGTNNFPTNYVTVSLSGGTVEYNGAGSQTIAVKDYYNLTSSGSGARTLGTTGNIGISGTFTPGSNSYTTTGSTIDFNAAGSQTIPVFTFDNVVFSGSGTKAFSGSTTVNSNMTISGSAVVNLGTNTSTAATLFFGSNVQAAGTWGGTGSGATNINTTYFDAATGILNVTSSVSSYTWIGGTSTAWEVASNWSPAHVPSSSSENAIIAAGGTYQPTISAAASCNGITLNSGSTLTISGSNTLTVSGNWTNNGGTLAAGSGTVLFNGTSQTIGGSSATTFYHLTTSATSSTTIGADVNVTGNLSVGDGTNLSIDGYALSVTGTTTVGTGVSAAYLTITSATGAKSFTGLVTIATGSTWNNSGNSAVSFANGITNNGTITAGSGVYTFQTNNQALTGTFNIPSVTITGITLTNNNTLTVVTALAGTGGLTQAAGATLNIGFAGTPGLTTLTATAAGNTVNYYQDAQTLIATTYVNLSLGGGGGKTFPTGTTTVNGVLSIENLANANTFTGSLAYGANATLQYNTVSARTASNEWVTPFVATGGVIVKNIGAITLNQAKVLDASIPLTINNGATLNTSTSNYQLTFGGDYINNGGTLTANASPIVIANTAATQNIAGFTTTGTVSMTKASGTATFTGNVTSGPLTINGSGGTLNLGTGRTHTCTNWNLQAGTLDGGSSTLSVSGTVVTGGTFNANTGTIKYTGASQTVAALNYYNLDLSSATTAITLASSGTIGVAGAFTAPGGITKTITGSTVSFNGSSSQSIPAFTFNNLTVANSAGVTLTGSVTVSGTLTLSSGLVTSTSTNVLAVTNTASGAVTGYSSSGYINGPLQWSMVTGNSYFFPVGDASYYRPFEMNSVTCSSAVVRVTMYSSGASTVDATLTSVAPRNWYAQLISGSFTSATIRLTESGLTSSNTVGSSSAQVGNYTNRGGNSIGSTITSDAGIAFTASAYFAVGSLATTPVVVLSDNGTQVAAADVSVGTTNVVLHKSALAVTVADAALTGMTCSTQGTYSSAGITNLKVWYQTTSTFTGTGTLLSTYASPGAAGAKTFPSFTSQTINNGTTGYIFITADVAAGATVGQTINLIALTYTDFTFTAASKSGVTSVGGTQTFVAGAASKFVITGSASQTAGSSQNLTITAKDANGNTAISYTGDKSVTFSGANSSTSPVTAPTVSNKLGSAIAFGSVTTLTFTSGVATVSAGNNGAMTLYKVETAVIAATEGSITTTGSDRLSVVVSAAALNKFALALSSPQNSGVAFTGTNTLTAQDAYGNTVTTFEASDNNITIAAVSPLTGSISGLSGTNKLTSASDFTNGVADLTALGMVYTGNSATGTFTATAATGGYTGTSGSVVIGSGAASKFVITGNTTQTAGVSQDITITAKDASGNTATAYTGDKSIVFSGANSSANPSTAPTVEDKNGTATAFGVSTTITFTNGVATVSAGANGVMTLYKVETANIVATEGSITTSGTDRLSVIVSAAGMNKFALVLESPQISGTAFTGINTLTAQDAYGNTVTSFEASANHVTIAAVAPLTGTVTGLSGTNVLTSADDFTSGVADLTALGMTYSGNATTGTFTATAATGGYTGTSGAVAFNAGSATKFVITGNTTQTAGASQDITITAKDAAGNTATGYTGNMSLIFSGASSSSAPVTAPTIRDMSGTAVPFGTATTITFISGIAMVSGGTNGVMTLYKSETADIVATEGSITTTGADRLSVVVSTAGMNKFALTLATPQVCGTAFTGTNTLTAQDAYGNTVTSFEASDNNVTIAANAPLTGSISGLSGTFKLTSVADFTDGVADLTALGITYTGNADTGTFTATSATGGYTGTSGSLVINVGLAVRFVITGNTAQTAGSSQSITITAKDIGGNTATGYIGDKSLTFSGAGSSTNPVTAPTIKDKSGTATAFGSATTITFISGVATVSGGNNGVMTLYKSETAYIVATEGSITTTGADRLSVVVSAAAMNKFDLVLASPQINGTAFTGTNTLTAQDAYGNTVTTFEASDNYVTLAPVDPLAGAITGLSGTNVLNSADDFTNGVANLTALGILYTGNAATGTFTATAATGGYTGTSGSLTINPGAATQIAIHAGDGQSVVAGTAVTTAPAAIVKDASNNPVPGVTVTFAVVSGGGSGTGLSQATNASGIATVGSWTLGTVAGSNTLTATSAGLAGSPLTFTATGTAGPATKYLVTSSSYGPVAGTEVTITAQLSDMNNNAVSTAGNVVTWSKSDPNGSFATTTSETDEDGIATVVFTTHVVPETATTVTGTDAALLAGTSATITTIAPATYYLTSAGAGNAQNPANWNTSPDGSGSPASSFTIYGDTFVVPVGISGVVSGAWTFGNASAVAAMTLTVEGTLTINSGVVVTLQQKDGGTNNMDINGILVFLGSDAANQLIGTVTGSGTATNNTVTLSGGATLVTANTGGISSTSNGSVNTTSLTLSSDTGANYEFNGTNQSTTGLPATVNNLAVSGTGLITLTDNLAIDGTLTLTSGSFTIPSGLSLIVETISKTSGNLQMQRQFTGVKGWRMIASPVNTTFSDLFDGNFVTQGFAGSTYSTKQPNLLWFDETEIGTTNMAWRQPSSLSDNAVGGSGYFYYIFNGAGISGGGTYADVLPMTMTANGLQHSTSGGVFTYSITYNERNINDQPDPGNFLDLNTDDSGWNLIGNPTTATLDWDATGGWTKTNMDNTIYVWDPSAGDFRFWNGSAGTLGNGLIAPFQAVWVKANNSSCALSFNHDAKTIGGAFYKSESPSLFPDLNLPLRLSVDSLKSTIFIEINENGIRGADPYDAYRLEPMDDTYMDFFTLSSPEHVMPLVINNLPYNFEDDVRIPLYVGGTRGGSSISGEYTLEWTIPDYWPTDLSITLMDHGEERAISMTGTDRYTFTYRSTKSSAIPVEQPIVPERLIQPVARASQLKSEDPEPFTIVISRNQSQDNPVYSPPTAQLLPIYPNPVDGAVAIRFTLPKKSEILLQVLDMYGRCIETIDTKEYAAGLNTVFWNSDNLTVGTYFIRLRDVTTVVSQTIVKI